MRIITRAQWGAVPRSLPAATMRLPATEVFIHHSVTTVTDYPIADMRSIERIGLSRFNQFSYSYVVHPHDGEILEGCGTRRGAHTSQKNSTSFGICWAGNYEERAPKVQQIDATRWLIAELIKAGHLSPEPPIFGHRDTGFATACPGSKLYALLEDLRRPWVDPDPTPPAPGGVPVANAPFAAILVHPNGGYLEVGEDGGVFAWGGAPFYGSLGGAHLNQPIVDAQWAPDHAGYYLLGRDGGVFTFGSAVHQGNALWVGG